MKNNYHVHMNLPKLLLFTILLSSSVSYGDDNYLKGYLSAVLEQGLGWKHEDYHISVNDAIATVTVKSFDKDEIAKGRKAFSGIPLLVDFNFVDSENINAGSLPVYIYFPRGDYFRPIIADIKEPQFFMSFIQIDIDDQPGNTLVSSVGIGQNFGLLRLPSATIGDGWQLSFFAALFSQFNMDSSSDDLLNSDYHVGFPLTFRKGSFSGRFRLFHQSSHLGDELLLSSQAPTRVNLSYEAIDMLLSYDLGNWRGMIGGAKIIRHNPSDLDERLYNAGIEYRNQNTVFGNSRFVAGLFWMRVEDVDWNSGTSLKFGLETGQTYPARHGTRIMMEVYKGLAPFGQFYTSEIEYYGLGMYFDFN